MRLALSFFTILRIRTPEHPDRVDWGAAMLAAPATGILLGLPAAGVMFGARLLYDPWQGTLVAAVLAFATLAVFSRGLHLDGLADTADGFGASRDALDVMRRGNVGPFGLATLLFVLLLDTTTLTACVALGHGTASLVTAVVTGRLAATLACTPATPAARPDGLGAAVAGTVPRSRALIATAIVVVLAAAFAYLDDNGGTRSAVRGASGVVAGLAVAHLLRAHAVRRIGGITGDVLGALVETATCAALLVLAISP